MSGTKGRARGGGRRVRPGRGIGNAGEVEHARRALDELTRIKGPDECADRVRQQLVEMVKGLGTGELLRLSGDADASVKAELRRETETVKLIQAFQNSGLSEFSDTCDVSDLAAFIWNYGDAEDALAGFTALLPVARRVWDRMPAKEK